MRYIAFYAVLTASAVMATAAHAADQTQIGASSHNWSGIYVGLQAGGAWARADGGDYHVDMSGGAIGAYVGANWQSGNWVVGIEGDVNYTSNEGTYTDGPASVDVGTEWQGAIRGRLGYVFDRVLVYGAGGLAISEVYVDALPILDKTETFTGWTVGGGVEYAFAQNWTTRLDYRYSDYGGSNFGLTGAEEMELTEHALRVGIGYRF